MPKKIPWWMPEIGAVEETHILEVLRTQFPNQGKLTTLLEEKLAALLGVKYVVMTTSGTTAIFLALKALGIGEGDEVLVPDITFIATANAVTLTGAKPVLVDVDPQTLNISALSIERAITSKTKAIVPVHVSGRSADMDAILKIAKEKNLVVVEDAAEALMSKRNGVALGTIGDAGCFSLSANKTITSGQGGVVVTNREDVFRRVRELKNQGVFDRLTGGDDVHYSLGFNFRYTDLQAAVALGQLEYLQTRLLRMRRNYELYKEYLAGVSGITLFPFDTAGGEVPQWTDCLVEKRDELDAYLRERNMDCRKYWLPLHSQAPYKLDDTAFPESTKLVPKSLWLPSAFTLTDEDVQTVTKAIKEFFA